MSTHRRSVHEFKLTTAAPFAAGAVRAYLAAHATPGRDVIWPGSDADTEHALDVPAGVAAARVHWAQIAEITGEISIPVTLRLPEVAQAGTVSDHPASDDLGRNIAIALLRRMFDLDTDPGEVAAALSPDPLIGPLVRLRPGLRLPGARHVAEHALGTVLGQQVSIAAARTLQGRLAAAFELRSAGSTATLCAENGERFIGPPDVGAIAAMPADELRALLGLTNARAATLKTLATALHEGLDLSPAADHTSVRSQLLALRGIGPWSVEVIALRVLGDADAYPAGDLILKRAIGAANDREARELAEAWRPYRGYATQHVWAQFHADQALKSVAQ